MTAERTIATAIHGRYLLEVAEVPDPVPLLVGFHGYAEQAAVQLDRLRTLRGSTPANLVAVQGLHRFYRSGGQEIAASWMTREDRTLMVADNIAYVNAVLEAIAREFHEPSAIVHVGFSQGASMGYRAAALCIRPPAGVIALGGDIPPELADDVLRRIPRVLIGAGARDRFYTAEKRTADARRLERAGVHVRVLELDAGHEWNDTFGEAAADWLQSFS
jgi:predicted esterase